MRLSDLHRKLLNRWKKFRLQPIRIFCLHHVSDTFDPSYMWECDWVNTDVLKKFILDLQQSGYSFISLPEAHERLKNDWLRRKRYAVLTADDGFKTLLNIVPRLIEQHIPITLFVNPKYILEDRIGENVQERLNAENGTASNEEIYLKKSDLDAINSPLVTIAYHGYEHLDEWKMDEHAFVLNVEQCERALQELPLKVIPYYAHTYGHAREKNDSILAKKKLTPAYVSGGANYNDSTRIDRELISNERLLNGKVHV